MSGNNLPERLQGAISTGESETVRRLIAEGVDVHTPGSYGAAPLTLASRYDNTDILQMLLEAGAEINASDKTGYTALMEAANCMKSDSLRLLIQCGAEINARSEIGATPLIYGVFALGENFETPTPNDVVAILLASGADLQLRDAGGKSALDIAKETGNEELVEFLLKNGAH